MGMSSPPEWKRAKALPARTPPAAAVKTAKTAKTVAARPKKK